jgi:peptide/nickel transport system substrate-binding protein
MHRITRRALTAVAAGAALPRFAIAQADQRPGITIAVQKISISNTLESLREVSNVGQRTMSLFTESLMEVDWTFGLGMVPRVAESWRQIDGKTLEVTLRQGVKLHNGDTLTAEDVAFSFGPTRMWSGQSADRAGLFASNTTGAGKLPPPEVPVAARATLPGFDRVEIVDARTVRFHNRTPEPVLAQRLTRNTAAVISRRAYEEAASWQDFARQPVATGPYRVAAFKPDTMLLLEAHDEYWGGRPPLKTIRLVEVPEMISRVNGLLAGDFDFACDLAPDQIPIVERSPRHQVLGGLIANIRLNVFDKTHPALANPLVRRAMTHGMDRQAIIDGLWAGRTVVPKGLQWPFYGEMMVQDWAAPAHDPALARDLLKQAGYKGEEIPYPTLNNYYTNQTPTAQVLLEGWRNIGLNVVLSMKENWSQVLPKGPHRGVIDNSNSAWFADPVAAMAAYAPGGQTWEAGQWQNQEAAGIMAFMQSELDQGKRRAAFRRWLVITEREDPCYAVLHQNATFTALRRDYRWKAAASFAMDFRARNWG